MLTPLLLELLVFPHASSFLFSGGLWGFGWAAGSSRLGLLSILGSKGLLLTTSLHCAEGP